MNIIGENIKRLREQQGLSIRKLAAKIGMSHNTLASYERESIMPSLDTGYRLAEYFDVPLEYLVKGEKVNSDFFVQGHIESPVEGRLGSRRFPT